MGLFDLSWKTAELEIANEQNQPKGLVAGIRGLELRTAKDVEFITDVLRNDTNITFLNLSGLSIWPTAAKCIALALQKNSQCNEVILKDCFKGDAEDSAQCLELIGDALIKAGAKLKVLQISENKLGKTGIRGVLKLLNSEACYTLEKLFIDNCALGETGMRLISEALIHGFVRGRLRNSDQPVRLRQIHAGGNMLMDEGALWFGKLIDVVRSLEGIYLQNNGINPKGLEVLAMAVTRNKELVNIDLHGNPLFKDGGITMATVVNCLPNMKNLNLSNCKIQSHDGMRIALGVAEKHHDFQEVNFSHNELNAAAGAALVKAFQNKPFLKKMDLTGNNFGNKGLQLCQQLTLGAFKPKAYIFGNDAGTEEGADFEKDILEALQQFSQCKGLSEVKKGHGTDAKSAGVSLMKSISLMDSMSFGFANSMQKIEPDDLKRDLSKKIQQFKQQYMLKDGEKVYGVDLDMYHLEDGMPLLANDKNVDEGFDKGTEFGGGDNGTIADYPAPQTKLAETAGLQSVGDNGLSFDDTIPEKGNSKKTGTEIHEPANRNIDKNFYGTGFGGGGDFGINVNNFMTQVDALGSTRSEFHLSTNTNTDEHTAEPNQQPAQHGGGDTGANVNDSQNVGVTSASSMPNSRDAIPFRAILSMDHHYVYKTSPAKMFIKTCEPCPLSMFYRIGTNKLQAIQDALQEFPHEKYILVLFYAALKCANLSGNCVEAGEIAIALFGECITNAQEMGEEAELMKLFQKELGPAPHSQLGYNRQVCRNVLRDTMRNLNLQSGSLTRAIKKYLHELKRNEETNNGPDFFQD